MNFETISRGIIDALTVTGPMYEDEIRTKVLGSSLREREVIEFNRTLDDLWECGAIGFVDPNSTMIGVVT